ncbi:Uncharacterised protein [Mycobacteroides abscessus subsp. abscessus]|nr:Uncharacterised protein [Mycobacteroides abscessus subsp. abscessus]
MVNHPTVPLVSVSSSPSALPCPSSDTKVPAAESCPRCFRQLATVTARADNKKL